MASGNNLSRGLTKTKKPIGVCFLYRDHKKGFISRLPPFSRSFLSLLRHFLNIFFHSFASEKKEVPEKKKSVNHPLDKCYNCFEMCEQLLLVVTVVTSVKPPCYGCGFVICAKNCNCKAVCLVGLYNRFYYQNAVLESCCGQNARKPTLKPASCVSYVDRRNTKQKKE